MLLLTLGLILVVTEGSALAFSSTACFSAAASLSAAVLTTAS
jgi:hypothetical protein